MLWQDRGGHDTGLGQSGHRLIAQQQPRPIGRDDPSGQQDHSHGHQSDRAVFPCRIGHGHVYHSEEWKNQPIYCQHNPAKYENQWQASWKKQLQIEQDRTADKIQKNASHFPDESDRATHEEEFTLELRTRERERRLLSKISESIEDLKSDDYGYCASCGIEIGIRRLEARPTATRCIDCKTIEEIHERQQYG